MENPPAPRQGCSDEILTRAEGTGGGPGVSSGWFGLLSTWCFQESWEAVWVAQHFVFQGVLRSWCSSRAELCVCLLEVGFVPH